MTYRVLVTGSRAWPDEATVEEALEEVRALGALVVVHGACPSGADAMASRWARRRSLVTEERHPALWRERPMDGRDYRLLHSGIGSSGLVSAHFSGHTTRRCPLRIWKVSPSWAFMPWGSTL